MIPFKFNASSSVVWGIRRTVSKLTGKSTVFLDTGVVVVVVLFVDMEDGAFVDIISIAKEGLGVVVVVVVGETPAGDGTNGASDGAGVGEGVTSDSAAGASYTTEVAVSTSVWS
jgi:hypothetical protein